MNFKRGLVLLLFAALARETGLAAAQRMPQRATQEAAVLKVERQWLDVRDTATLERILAADFVHVLPQGFVTRKEELAYRNRHGFDPTDIQKSFEEIRIRIYGHTAIANGIVLAKSMGRPGVRRTRFTDIFIYRRGRWQAVNAQETPIPVSMQAH